MRDDGLTSWWDKPIFSMARITWLNDDCTYALLTKGRLWWTKITYVHRDHHNSWLYSGNKEPVDSELHDFLRDSRYEMLKIQDRDKANFIAASQWRKPFPDFLPPARVVKNSP